MGEIRLSCWECMWICVFGPVPIEFAANPISYSVEFPFQVISTYQQIESSCILRRNFMTVCVKFV